MWHLSPFWQERHLTPLCILSTYRSSSPSTGVIQQCWGNRGKRQGHGRALGANAMQFAVSEQERDCSLRAEKTLNVAEGSPLHYSREP